MRCISLRPPWPYCIFHLGKGVENRGEHFLKYSKMPPCPLLIHASKTWDEEGYRFITQCLGEYVPSRNHHVFGAIRGVVDFVEIITTRENLDLEDQRWFFGDVGLVFENPKEFKKPIFWRGQLGIFDVPEYVLNGKLT